MGSSYLEDPDVRLMLRVKDGEASAFDDLVRRYAPILVNFMYRFVGSRAAAEDLAQETFLKVFRAAPTYKPTARFKTWILTIARNLCLNQKRWEKGHFHYSIDAQRDAEADRSLADDLETGDDQPQADLERSELQQKVRDAIMTLPENQRTALILARFHESPYAEIAEVMGITVMAVKSLLNRARENLHGKLERELRDFNLDHPRR